MRMPAPFWTAIVLGLAAGATTCVVSEFLPAGRASTVQALGWWFFQTVFGFLLLTRAGTARRVHALFPTLALLAAALGVETPWLAGPAGFHAAAILAAAYISMLVEGRRVLLPSLLAATATALTLAAIPPHWRLSGFGPWLFFLCQAGVHMRDPAPARTGLRSARAELHARTRALLARSSFC
jgi:hypothetical protein